MEEKQKEQKPNIELIQKSWYMEGYHDGEFNREPKWIIKTGEGGPRYEENPKYGQIIEQKPAEWNEEDDVMLDKVCGLINPGTILTDDNADYCVELKLWIISLHKRLKSLRPQPHWKPSDEQMDALRSKLPIIMGTGNYVDSLLESLFQDLKKL